MYRTWTRRLEGGCAAWMAKEAWANFQLLTDLQCEEWEPTRIGGRGVIYPSVADHLIFLGYWSWSQGEYFDLIEFDNEGAISEIRPCPHALSQLEIDAMHTLVREALDGATTDAEKRVLARVDERLAATDGAALASGQMGCTDLRPNWHRIALPRADPWTRR